ncbi:unnamed protein product (macronuclear) [Paramecium tetraurelia]|uniref:Vacuolar protein 14 C-terminal Fig4-binding domain-containing protein n=1 Tax=Paramecium tetraurelia TaxID=5888 RepID=A0EEU8_PARTE|nr:uncharacterized protein GSPATT00026162001 [Paramecium tetraurelia]CAK93839.1 unnamed protein product [Paramecium tetraurelia]|eukprot:XP_001461212.1 hypothetical protein (macronuclear) [Paramecium tetraurelia strain d4-2]
MDEKNINLPEPVTKNLFDKSQEKREQGGAELIKVIQNATEKTIIEIAKHLKDRYISQQQFQYKKGGLHGLYSIAIDISKKETIIKNCLNYIIDPMVDCMRDKEERVRYTAIEYLFLTSKQLGDYVLNKLEDIYSYLVQSFLDPDESVRKAASQLDNCLKSLVTSTAPEKQNFKIQSFVKTISQQIVFKNQQVKLNLISWINTLNSIPHIELFDYIDGFLIELFLMLADTNNKDPFTNEAKVAARKQLEEFQRDLERYSKRSSFNQTQEMKTHRQIIHILLGLFLNWIMEYLKIVSNELDQPSVQFNPLELSGGQIIKGIDLMSNIFEQRRDSVLQSVIMEKLNNILKIILSLLSLDSLQIVNQAQQINDLLLQIMDKMKASGKEFVDIMPTIQDMLKEKNNHTAEKALMWMRHLLNTQTEKLKPMIENILENLIERLKDAEAQVVENVMDVLARISHEQYFDMVIEKILDIFHKNVNLLNRMSQIIIKKLCEFWNAEVVYTQICNKLLENYVYVGDDNLDLAFTQQLVQSLEYLLITEPRLQNIRMKLKNYKYEKNQKTAKSTYEFFISIYKTFCYNEVSALSLSLLIEEYELTYNIILTIAEQETNVEILVQIARLTLLLESPVFAYLRLQLLESANHPFLIQSLQGLMMLLPQSPIQKYLKSRLKNIELFIKPDSDLSQNREIQNKLDTQLLLQLFKNSKQEQQDLKDNYAKTQSK